MTGRSWPKAVIKACKPALTALLSRPLHPVPPLRLPSIKGGIRLLQKLIERLRAGEFMRNAKGRRTANRLTQASASHFTMFDRCPRALCQLQGAGAIGVQGDDHELLAAQAADQVALACSGLEDFGNTRQDEVADVVAVGFIGAFEVVNIHDQQIRRASRARAEVGVQGC